MNEERRNKELDERKETRKNVKIKGKMKEAMNKEEEIRGRSE